MTSNAYLFTAFRNREVNLSDAGDPVKAEMTKVAEQNGLTLVFNRFGLDGGAPVVPPENQVTVTLMQGNDNKWRVYKAG